MLLLMIRRGGEVIIDGVIRVKILELIGNKVKIGIEAPRDITIFRKELVDGSR